MEKIKTIIIYGIAFLSGIWLFVALGEGIRVMGRLYFEGDLQLAGIISFMALLGLFAPKVYFKTLKKRQTEKELQDISKKYFEK